MRKFSLFFLLCSLMVQIGGQPQSTNPLLLNGGNAFSGIEWEEALILKQGDKVYLITIQRDRFLIYFSSDNGMQFSAYPLSTDMAGFASVRDLQLSALYSAQNICFFIGTTGSRDGLYALGIDGGGNLGLVLGDCIEHIVYGDQIHSYSIFFDIEKGAGILFSAEKAIGFIHINPDFIPISTPVEAASYLKESSQFFYSDFNGVWKYFGTYVTAETPGEYKVQYFEIDSQGQLAKLEIYTSSLLNLNNELLISAEEELYCIALEGKTLKLYHKTDLLWEAQPAYIAGIAAVNGKITRYELHYQREAVLLMCTVENTEGEDLYILKFDAQSGLQLANSSEKFNTSLVAGGAVFPENVFLMQIFGFITRGNANDTLNICYNTIGEDDWKFLSREFTSGESVLTGTHLFNTGAYFYKIFYNDGEDNPHTLYFRYEPGATNLYQSLDFSGKGVATWELASNKINPKPGIFPRSMVLDLETEQSIMTGDLVVLLPEILQNENYFIINEGDNAFLYRLEN